MTHIAMLKVQITIVCPTGKNRSRFLKEHLKEEGYLAYAVGLNDKSADASRKIKKARVVISVDPSVQEQLKEQFDLSDKSLICLDVDDTPNIGVSEQKKLTGEQWLEFQHEHVYPTLRKQMKKHLPLLV